MQEQEKILETALESDTGGLPFKLITGQDPASAINPPISNPPIASDFCYAMWKNAQGQAKRIFAKQAVPSMQNAADEAVSVIFLVGFEEANT